MHQDTLNRPDEPTLDSTDQEPRSPNYLFEALRKYVVFSGRARRREYWMFVLLIILIHLGFIIIDALNFEEDFFRVIMVGTWFGAVVPGLAVCVRRLHDTSRSGWWCLLNAVPLIGWVVLLVFMVQDSHEGVNQYGENPKARRQQR